MSEESIKVPCIALDNCTAIEIIDDKYKIIKSKKNASVKKIYWKNGEYKKEERDLYAKCAERKPISKTEITIDTESILEKLNQTMKSLGIGEFSIDLENVPTALEYKKTVIMKKLMKNALLNQKITSEEVKGAEQVLSIENEKEEF